MAPRARRTAMVVEPETLDGIEQARERDAADTGDALDNVLDELSAISVANAKVNVYKETEKGGQWAYVRELGYPLQTEGLLDELRQEWGGGQYYFRVFANGKVVTTKRVVIAGDKTPRRAVADTGSLDVARLLMEQSNAGKSDMQAMMQMMMAQAAQANQQQAQMAQQQQTMMMGLLTAIMGKTPDNPLSTLVPLLEVMRPNTQPAPMSEMIASMAAMKELIGGGDGGGGGDDSFLGGAGKALLPMIGKMAESAMSAQPPQVRAPQPVPQQFRPNPAPAIAAPPTPPPYVMPPIAPASKPRVVSKNPLIALIADDVTFMAKRNYSPEVAAEAVLQRIADAGVSESDILSLVVRFQTAPDWIADLVGEGIDLTRSREWATAFLASLIDQYTEGREEDHHTGGNGGGEGNPQADAGFSA